MRFFFHRAAHSAIKLRTSIDRRINLYPKYDEYFVATVKDKTVSLVSLARFVLYEKNSLHFFRENQVSLSRTLRDYV